MIPGITIGDKLGGSILDRDIAFQVGQVITFDASRSRDPDGTIVRYDWDFGDGATKSETGAATTHSYSKAGTFKVILIVTDNDGLKSAPFSLPVVVSAYEPPAPDKLPPIAAFAPRAP